MSASYDFHSDLLSNLKDGYQLKRKPLNHKMQKGPDMVREKLSNEKILFSSHYAGMEIQNEESDSDSGDEDGEGPNPRITRTPSIRPIRSSRRRQTTTISALPSSSLRSVSSGQTLTALPTDFTSPKVPTTNNTSVLTYGGREFQRSFDATTFVILPILAVLSVICLVVLIIYLLKHHRRKKVKDETSAEYRDFSTNNSMIPLTRLNPENVIYYDIDGPPEIISTTNVPLPLNHDGGIYHEIDHSQVSLHDSKQNQKDDANVRNIAQENEYFKLEPQQRNHPYSNLSGNRTHEFYELAKPLSQITNDESQSTSEYFKLESTKKNEYQNENHSKNDSTGIQREVGTHNGKQSNDEYFTLEACAQNKTTENVTFADTDDTDLKINASRAENEYFTLEISSSNDTENNTSSLETKTKKDATVAETDSKSISTRPENDYFTLEIGSSVETKQDHSPLEINSTSIITGNKSESSGSDSTHKDNEYFVLENTNKTF